MKNSDLSGLETLKREALTKKFEITNTLEYLEEGIQNPKKYSHIKINSNHFDQIQNWFIERAEELNISREKAEEEFSWFIWENGN